MAKGKSEENNPKRRPPRPPRPTSPRSFVPMDSPIRQDEKEMRIKFIGRDVGSMSTNEQMIYADEALRERPPSTRELHDERYDEDKSSY